jgi:3-oxoacyl-[acyl-carrier protein] reductase
LIDTRGKEDAMGEFTGKTFVVTGAASGIGRACAMQLWQRGARVALLDRSSAALAEACAPFGDHGLPLALDIADSAQCVEAANRIAAWSGEIDGVITSAGIYRDHPAVEMDATAWRETLSVNLDGVFYIISACLPHLAVGSSIVTLTSMAAHMGGSLGHAHYGASKGGVLALTRGLARELGPKTRVNAVSPGVIETPMTSGLLQSRGETVLQQTPMKRFGTADDIASAVLFLCSPAASFITGEALHVNGGIYMA